MTKGMTWAATSVQKFWRRRLRFGFELRPPIAERLEWNPVRFAILSLIQRALLPRLMVLAPKNLAVTLTGSKFVGHLVSSLLKIHRREQIASEPRGNKRARNGRLPPCVRNGRLRFLSSKSLIPFENSLFFKIFSLIICVGNCSRSDCSAAVSWYSIVPLSPRIAKFPVKFPDTREFAWRRVRSALRRQPGSPALREAVPDSRRNARQQRAFLIQRTVSSLPISPAEGRNCQKSLATCRNIPVFGRRQPETGFDPHCMPGASSRLKVFQCLDRYRIRRRVVLMGIQPGRPIAYLRATKLR